MDTITVCVCTYQRPIMLEKLIKGLQHLRTENAFTINLVVVDNDSQGSAGFVFSRLGASISIPTQYAIEPEKNISLARNRALRLSEGDFIACIDDDEFPDEQWLLNLYKAIHKFEADGVLGPVVPFYETQPPKWITRSFGLERKSFPSGTILKSSASSMRSGNFMISKRIISENSELFRPEYGCLGGEDTDFFSRMLVKGYRFVWSNEARVLEHVPPSRMEKSYYFKRALLNGVVSAKRKGLVSIDTLKSIVAVAIYSAALPFIFLLRPRLLMLCLVKDCHHFAKMLARCGVVIVKNRPD